MTAVRKFHWFWPWQDDREEAWLAGLARQGLHLARVDGLGRYEFAPGEPREMVYRLGYCSPSVRDREEYLRPYRTAGWEPLGQMRGWHYFRKPAASEEPEEIPAGVETRIERFRRITGALAPLLIVWIPVLGAVRWQDSLAGRVLQVATFLIFVLYLYVLTSLLRRVSKLRKRQPGRKV